jgi:hypothetical protein
LIVSGDEALLLILKEKLGAENIPIDSTFLENQKTKSQSLAKFQVWQGSLSAQELSKTLAHTHDQIPSCILSRCLL